VPELLLRVEPADEREVAVAVPADERVPAVREAPVMPDADRVTAEARWLPEEERADELRTVEPLREDDEAPERVTLPPREALREWKEDTPRTEVPVSRCPSWAAMEGSQRWPPPHM
jgi:hypothetical protein